MTRIICVVTGSRAEYGLLRGVMQEIVDAPDLRLQVIATGMHLLPQFGSTWREIEADNFAIDRKVEMLLGSDTAVGVSKSIGVGVMAFADAFADLQPDVVLVLGDRFEIFSAVVAAHVARIPVAHIHGGETTEGAFDEAFRHSITKMSQLHFVAAEQYRQRVIQLGESPDKVWLSGGLGVDGLQQAELLGRAELETSLGFGLGTKSLLVTFHPVTLESDFGLAGLGELLNALGELSDTQLIFTLPNADTGGQSFIDLINRFVSSHSNARAFASLGQRRYLSCMALVDGVVGNSSSGLLEAPSFRKGTVNVGDRQRGRLMAKSVINCAPTRADIRNAIETLFSSDFQRSLAHVINPYGEGGASAKIVDALSKVSLVNIVKKPFYDLPLQVSH